MLSVTTATVHRAMCPGTPQNTTPERKDRSWSCDYNAISKRRCRATTSRKNLSLRLSDPLELNIEVSSHPIAADKTPKSKIPISKIHSNTISTSKPRRHAVTLLKQEKTPTHSLCVNPVSKEASQKAAEAESSSKESTGDGLADKSSEAVPQPKIQSPNEVDGKSIEEKEKKDEEKNYDEKNPDEKAKPSPQGLSSSPLEAGGKRKRGSESRMSAAIKMLKSDDNDVDYSKRRPALDSTIEESQPDEGINVPRNDLSEGTSPSESQLQGDNWNSEENWNKLQEENWNKIQQENWEYNQQDNWVNPYCERQEIWHNPQTSNWDNWDDGSAPVPAEDPFDQLQPEEPFYMTGFPNPPAENRCWLNATLQTIFALPLVDPLGRLDMTRCSMLTKTLMAIQLFWRRGAADREKTYQTVARFKNQLDILDDTYSSYRQQDVSEFLMKLLNHVKNDCEKIIKEMKSPDETENVPEASVVKATQRSPQTPLKRPPLAQISPFKSRNDCSDVSACSPKSHESTEESSESILNPIDEFFLLPMMERYVCQNCHKHRQRKVDNMMLYVDLPENATDPIELADAIGKSLEPEDRTLTCGKCKCEKHKLFTTFRGLPNVLIVQINRYGMSDGYVAKMNSVVHISEILEISTDEGKSEDRQCQKFIPVCIIAHVGSAMDCGHYTSYVKHGDQWFHYNDMNVTPMSTSEALTAAQTTAYLVFFVNADLLPKSPSLEDGLEEVSR
ncbi:ubiquitin carboxyl-terminal hydrolase 8 [Diachasma alloeum]|uniref:ubiquitin carboxyl-terminal hydrolase 8 n=1 Tax=Diachasma alloeum TaxID=454923 RepID=UPI0007382074|nr:ubiquitin carboxyl-terminal hydrolase 8 [Diachasma alloeum]